MDGKGALIVTGVIVRRRCCGKQLSFANIRHSSSIPPTVDDDDQVVDDIDDGSASETNNETKVIFRRAHFQGDNFPIKSSDLPYGARVSMTVDAIPHKDDLLQVISWRMLEEDPKAQALRMAKTGEGVMCSTYLQVRADAYFTLNQKQECRIRTRLPASDQGSIVSPHGKPTSEGPSRKDLLSLAA